MLQMWRTRSHEKGLQGKNLLHNLLDNKPRHQSIQETPQQYPKSHKQPHPNQIPSHSNITTFNGNNHGSWTKNTGAINNGPLFHNLFDIQPPRTSMTIHTPFNGASPEQSANMTEAISQILAQVANNRKKDGVSKQMMKNIKICDGTKKVECITWLSQIEAATRFSNTILRTS